MADPAYAILTGEGATYLNSATEDKSLKTKARFLKMLIACLVFMLVCEFLFYVFIMPARSPAYIKVSGNTSIKSSTLLTAIGLDANSTWFSVDADDVLSRLKDLSIVADAKVEKVFPDKVFISITEREACAMMFADHSGKTVPMLMDKTGTIFHIGWSSNIVRLPVLSGLTIENPRVGMHVHPDLAEVFEAISRLHQVNPTLLGEISEIKIEEKAFGNYELVLFPVRVGLPVRTTKELTQKSLQSMLLFLDAIPNIVDIASIEEIDIRSGSAVIKKRGGNE